MKIMVPQLQPIGPEIWIADGPDVSFLGLSIPTRTTIVRLPGQRLWVHSPIKLTPSLRDEILNLGAVTALIAPNKYHHLFLDQWLDTFPNAHAYAGPGLREKRSDLKFAGDLSNDADSSWSSDIEQTVFTGGRLFDEVIFFHTQSRTLILTDLIVNLRTEGFSFLQRLIARVDGLAFPHGGMPNLFRLTLRNHDQVRPAIERMLKWNPLAVIISHGEWFRENGAAEIKSRLQFLLKP